MECKSEKNRWISYYCPTSISIWTGRKDFIPDFYSSPNRAQRIYELIHCVDLRIEKIKNIISEPYYPTQKLHPKAAIIGFCSDLGVYRNKGRTGSALAPPLIRKKMANLAIKKSGFLILDAGDVIVEQDIAKPADSVSSLSATYTEDPLKQAQQLLKEKISKLISQHLFTVILGGGHEVAKPHFDAIQQTYPGQKIGIINIDAHFDLRQDSVMPTSGTTFYEIWKDVQDLHDSPSSRGFHYMVIGIQPNANTHILYETARHTGTHFIEAQDIPLTGIKPDQEKKIKEFIDKVDKLMLTICMDVFQSSISPGVSAPSPLGLFPQQIYSILKLLMNSSKLISVDIAESNPLFDENDKTISLSASLACQTIMDMHYKV